MADRKPLKVLPDGGADSTGLSEFRTGDTIGVPNGGTGLTTVATSNLLTGNGASALSAESGLTFDGSVLAVTGAMTMANAAGPTIVNEAATATNPTLIPNKAEVDTGYGWAAADTLTVITGGTERMRIDNAGQVGIGTSDPEGTLDIYKSVAGFSAASHLKLTNENETDGDYTGILFDARTVADGGKGWFGFERQSDFGVGDFVFSLDNVGDDNTVAASDEVMRITRAGYVGIGNATPSTYLNSVNGLIVGDTGDATSEITIASNSGVGELNWTNTADTTNQYGIAVTYAAGTMKFSLAGWADAMTLVNGGKSLFNETANTGQTVGITINQGTNTDEFFAAKNSSIAHGITDFAETDTIFTVKRNGGDGGSAITGLTTTSTALELRAYITNDSTGKSTIGTGALNISASKKSGSGLGAMGTDANLMCINNHGTTRFCFDGEGSGHADVEWTTYSDSRLKTNVIDCPYGLAEVLQLEPKAFDKHGGKIEDGEVVLEENSRRMIGFLAQDVKALMPELVKDLPDDQSFYSLNDGKLAAVLVNAIKELNDKLEAN